MSAVILTRNLRNRRNALRQMIRMQGPTRPARRRPHQWMLATYNCTGLHNGLLFSYRADGCKLYEVEK